MPRSGSTYTAPASSWNPAVGSTVISSTDFNALLADVVAALSDSTSFAAAQGQAYLWGGIAGGTANAITISLTPAITAYTNGLTVRFYTGASANTGPATLAINGLTALPIKWFGLDLTANQIAANTVYEVTYYNSVFHLFPARAQSPVIVGSASNLAGNRSFLNFAQASWTADELVLKDSTGLPKISALSAMVDITLNGISGIDTGSMAATAVTCDNTTDKIAWTSHGMSNFDGVVFSAAVMPTGLTAGTMYFVRDVSANDFKVSSIIGGAAINFTTDGTTVVAIAIKHFYVWAVDRTTPTINQSVTADSTTDKITFTAHPFLANVPIVFGGTAVPTGLTAGTTYYVRDVATNDFKVAGTPGGAAIDITANGTAVTVSTTPGAIMSLSGTAPTMPTSYSYKALISTVRHTTTTALRNFQQFGREYFIDPEVAFAAKAVSLANAYESQTIAHLVPPNAKIISGQCGSTDTGTQTSIMIAGSASTGLGGMGHNSDGSSGGVIDTFAGLSGFRVPMQLSQQIVYKSAVTTATCSVNITGFVI